MSRALIPAAIFVSGLVLASSAGGALEVRLSISPNHPVSLEPTQISLRTFLPFTRADGSCCDLKDGGPKRYPFGSSCFAKGKGGANPCPSRQLVRVARGFQVPERRTLDAQGHELRADLRAQRRRTAAHHGPRAPARSDSSPGGFWAPRTAGLRSALPADASQKGLRDVYGTAYAHPSPATSSASSSPRSSCCRCRGTGWELGAPRRPRCSTSGFSAGALGAVAAASVTLRPPWRGRVRLLPRRTPSSPCSTSGCSGTSSTPRRHGRPGARAVPPRPPAALDRCPLQPARVADRVVTRSTSISAVVQILLYFMPSDGPLGARRRHRRGQRARRRGRSRSCSPTACAAAPGGRGSSRAALADPAPSWPSRPAHRGRDRGPRGAGRRG